MCGGEPDTATKVSETGEITVPHPNIQSQQSKNLARTNRVNVLNQCRFKGATWTTVIP
jgi:hypothetical protein